MKKIGKKYISPAKLLASGFMAIILTGGILLCLPISSSTHTYTHILDCIFTATSAVCVTGLVVVDTGTHWSTFGQVVIICLIQIGGIGFMSLATFIFLIARKRISMQSRIVLKDSYNLSQTGGIVRIAKHVLIFTFTTELIGALLSMITFVPRFGLVKGIGVSVFHSIASFCNAGFDVLGNYNSLTEYAANPFILIVTSMLIIIGGLGFFVIEDIASMRKGPRTLSFHTKLVLSTTLALIFFGALIIFIFEYNNPQTLGPLSLRDKIVESFFNSVTPRTAGFNSLNMLSLTSISALTIIILMFVGGSPGSTAGGIKTTTISVLLITLYCWIRGKDNIEVFHRRIGFNSLKKSITITTITVLLILFDIFILSYTENGTLRQIAFEVFSAFGTVGLTMNFTPELSAIGKIIIITAMYIGRLGPLTIALALSKESTNADGKYQYPEGDILLG
ncbi:MAG: Trk family potassium uptake protein [Eubacteriaceae bacterium]|nr:Trk family potassium uptake protein [Eubacteriaceae bacterium]